MIKPTQFAFFLMSNVVMSPADPPDPSNFCILGFHSVTGSPYQTYGIADWDSTTEYGLNTNSAIPTHELAE